MVRHDRSPPPTEAELADRLGASFPAYRALLDAHPDLEPAWRWYGQKNGWRLELLEGKRSLCFVDPADGGFSVGFALDHDAIQRALASELAPELHHAIAASAGHAHGRPFRLDVRSEGDLEPVHVLVRIRHGSAGKGPARAPKERRPSPLHTQAPTQPRPDRLAPSQRRGRSPG